MKLFFLVMYNGYKALYIPWELGDRINYKLRREIGNHPEVVTMIDEAYSSNYPKPKIEASEQTFAIQRTRRGGEFIRHEFELNKSVCSRLFQKEVSYRKYYTPKRSQRPIELPSRADRSISGLFKRFSKWLQTREFRDHDNNDISLSPL